MDDAVCHIQDVLFERDDCELGLEIGTALKSRGALNDKFVNIVERVALSARPFWCEQRTHYNKRHYIDTYSLAEDRTRKHRLYVAIPSSAGGDDHLLSLSSFLGKGGLALVQPGKPFRKKVYLRGLSYLVPGLPSLEQLRKYATFQRYEGEMADWVKLNAVIGIGVNPLYSKLISLDKLGPSKTREALTTYFSHSPHKAKMETLSGCKVPEVSKGRSKKTMNSR